MIATCTYCHRCYWRYKVRWETPGFCTSFCHDSKLAEKRGWREESPGIPIAIQQVLISHIRIVHGQDAELPQCAECERLEDLLSAAIAYHTPATAEQIAVTQAGSQTERRL